MSRANEIIRIIDASTLGSVSARIKDKKTFDSITKIWDESLNRLSEAQYRYVINHLPKLAKSNMSLGDVLSIADNLKGMI